MDYYLSVLQFLKVSLFDLKYLEDTLHSFLIFFFKVFVPFAYIVDIREGI